MEAPIAHESKIKRHELNIKMKIGLVSLQGMYNEWECSKTLHDPVTKSTVESN